MISTYQLLQKLNSFFDPQLALKVISFYESKNFLQADWLHKEKIAILMKTKLYPKIIEEVQKFQNIPGFEDNIQKCQEQDIKEITFVEDVEQFFNAIPGVFEKIEKENLTKQKLTKFISMKPEYVQPAMVKSKFLYDIGQYKEALELISTIIYIQDDDKHSREQLQLLWGKINLEFLVEDLPNRVEKIKDTLRNIRERVDHEKFLGKDSSYILKNKAFVIHIVLYLIFRFRVNQQDFDNMFETCFSVDQYLTAMQLLCPYMIKYLICMILLSKYYQFNDKNGQFVLNLLAKNCFDYKDSFTEFFKELLINFNFDTTKKLIQQIGAEIECDFFLAPHKDILLKNIQFIYFETYCRIFGEIRIEDVSQFLGCNLQSAEKWIVTLFSQSNIQAKIDSQSGVITIKQKKSNYHDEIQHQIKDLVARTSIIAANIKRMGVN